MGSIDLNPPLLWEFPSKIVGFRFLQIAKIGIPVNKSVISIKKNCQQYISPLLVEMTRKSLP